MRDTNDLIEELRVALHEHAEALARLRTAVERRGARLTRVPLDAESLRRHTAELQAVAEVIGDPRENAAEPLPEE